MNLCSVGNNWPWCFNSSMKNQTLQGQSLSVTAPQWQCFHTENKIKTEYSALKQQSFQLPPSYRYFTLLSSSSSINDEEGGEYGRNCEMLRAHCLSGM